ncbi:hypothetical protein EDD11_007631 [Mortierella claussenii]|nr:hypothetical protein EDD11_007631 [Mortierella claussenii]
MAAGTHQSIHQQRHRAQQQAQSAHSRSYHLHKHMRMLDQQRAAQLAVQQQQQQAQQQKQQQQQGHTSKPIQRHYQPHQQMYPVHSHPIPIKPHPAPPAQQQQTQKQQQQQPVLRPNPLQPQQRLTPQQQILHRFQQQRQLQQKQQQLRQLQYLRSRQTAPYPTQKNSLSATTTFGSQSPTPPRVFGSHVDRPIKKSTRPLECSNCMALDSLSWKPRIEPAVTTVTDGAATTTASSSSDSAAEATASGTPAAGSRMLCPACTQYLQAHGKPRPVPPFRTNFLKKVHTRFKRELQEVRFQGWQDAQVLEIEDRMVEREFQIVFNGLDENETSQLQSRPLSAAGSPRPVASTAAVVIDSSAATGSDASIKEGGSTSEASSSAAPAAKETETIVIKIEDDDDVVPSSKVKPDNVEVRTFQSETSVGELFGHRWRTEPVVGYTLVHFGGSDRTRMVPMNPTVPSLTVTFNRSAETITFAFRVLVNGLCLLSSGGGPPALHMPEMADDDESEEEEEEVVVVPDNDKDERSPSPPTTTGDKAAAASGSLGSNHSHVGTPTSIASKEKTPATEAASAGRMEVDMESTSVDVPASEAS